MTERPNNNHYTVSIFFTGIKKSCLNVPKKVKLLVS